MRTLSEQLLKHRNNVEIVCRIAGKVAKLEAELEIYNQPATCNLGHKSLPIKLWDCPSCTAELKAENEALRDGHEEIIMWGKAYPLGVFPEPDQKKAHKLLKAGGMTLDAVSASAMRHVLKGVVRIAKDALLTGEEKDDVPVEEK